MGIRAGRVSSVNYTAGTYEVTYADQRDSVSSEINAVCNGEYKMPKVGDMVYVMHADNGAEAAGAGTIWNDSNRPKEGFKGLYRKELDDTPGRAYSRYDSNTGVYTLVVGGTTITVTDGTVRISGARLYTDTEEG